MPPKDDEVIYASGVRPRTAAILRAFALNNDLTFSKLMDILANVVVEVTSTGDLFDGKVAELKPEFGHLDQLLREYMEQNMPETYAKAPVIRRLFGRMFKPVTRQQLKDIDRALDQKAELEIPEVPEPDADK